MYKSFPVVDIFAGPGGLGEGFSQAGFDVVLSCEMDPVACKTLTLRKFFHLFDKGSAPTEYYEFISNKITLEELIKKFPQQWNNAERKVLNIELGSPNTAQIVNKRIKESLTGQDEFILVGGPPCQAYSIAGRSRRLGLGNKIIEKSGLKMSSKKKSKLMSSLVEDFYNDPRHKLYLEYLEILATHQPAVFVMENVKGLTSARAGSIEKPGSVFSNIISGLREPSQTIENNKSTSNDIMLSKVKYKLYSVTKNREEELFTDLDKQVTSPKDCIIKAEEFNVPQSRHRIIIIGVREDLKGTLIPLKPSLDRATVADTISHLPKLRSGLSKQSDSTSEWLLAINKNIRQHLIGQTSTVLKLDKYLSHINNRNEEIDRGAKVIKFGNKATCSELNSYLEDPKMDFVIQHQTRGHIVSDLLRYFFCSAYGLAYGRSPKISDWEGNLSYLRPNHQNIGINNNKLGTNTHNDRFRVQLWDRPSSTIVSHISKDGHYFIHPDPTQCRSLTVREAARLQTFPDNYYFFGNKTQQYHQVGNAVPSFLSKKIAKQISAILIDSKL